MDQDERELELEIEEARKRKVIEDAELQAILNTEGGRFLLWRILSQAGVFRTNPPDDLQTMAFREGRRSIGLWLIHLMEAVDPKGFSKVQQEARTRAVSTNQGMDDV